MQVKPRKIYLSKRYNNVEPVRSMSEIGRQLGISEQAVDYYLRNAVRKIRKNFTKEIFS